MAKGLTLKPLYYFQSETVFTSLCSSTNRWVHVAGETVFTARYELNGPL